VQPGYSFNVVSTGAWARGSVCFEVEEALGDKAGEVRVEVEARGNEEALVVRGGKVELRDIGGEIELVLHV
jgi:hypothetical protein